MQKTRRGRLHYYINSGNRNKKRNKKYHQVLHNNIYLVPLTMSLNIRTFWFNISVKMSLYLRAGRYEILCVQIWVVWRTWVRAPQLSFFCRFFAFCVTTQVFQHSCGKYSPDVDKLFVGGWRIPSQKHGANIRPRTNTFSKTCLLYTSPSPRD